MQEVNRSSDSLQDATADSPFCIVSVNEKKVNIFCVHFYVVLIFTLFVYCFCFPATPCTCHHIAYWKWARYLSTKRISTTPSLGSKEPNRSFVMKMGKLPDCNWSWCAFNSSEYWKRWIHLIYLVNESWCYFKIHFQSKRFNEALGFCDDVLHNNPEDEFRLEVSELKGRIHFSLGNYTEAKRCVGDAYEMVCRGKDYDGIIKQSKLIFIKHNFSEMNKL